MSNSEEPTCGKGLAENSVLPESLGKLLGAMGENLAVHMKALDLTDENSRAEHQAYESLVTQLQEISSHLEKTAAQMAGYRDLPMGRHDEKAMTQPAVLATFEKFVEQKRALLVLLQETADRDDQLLEMMRMHRS